MSIRLKIFLSFILIVTLGLSIVVYRTISMGQIMSRVETLYEIEKATSTNQTVLILHEEISVIASTSSRNAIVLAVFTVVIVLSVAYVISGWIAKKVFWYEHILDCIPFPLSITDKDRKWTFINKPVETMLGLKRASVIGKPCSNWGASICGTDNCGVECLLRGKTSTTFEQTGANLKVDIAYLLDSKGRHDGHIEIVQDITEMIQMQKEEATLVEQIEDVSRSFVFASRQIADGSQALAQGSTEQAASIDRLSLSIGEIADKTKANAEMADRAASLANTIKQNAEKGSLQMDEMTSAVRDINAASQSISKVIKAIDDIAFQTNILALNAAVEAARAGQHGKGFAVVAEEVRNLAGKSAEAAKDTGALIANSMEKAELGARIADETAASLAEIVSGINESSQIVSEIAKSSEEQSIGIAEINHGIDQVAQVVQQNSATAEQSAASSAEMSDKSAILDNLVTQFQNKYGGDGKNTPSNQARQITSKRAAMLNEGY